ncbi:MAG: DUF5677 domain-containing protein [Anaerovorax sp.]|nr:DUF5677 domain-containing protein [Anaerovorax sp.]
MNRQCFEEIIAETETIVEACEKILDLENIKLSETYYYDSLPLCVLDAIFSIGVKYSSTINVVKRYCDYFNLNRINYEKNGRYDLHTITDLIVNIKSFGIKQFSDKIVCNCQRTSTKKGILKTEAVLRFAQIFEKYGILTFNDLHTKGLPDSAKKEIKNIPGQKSGISLQYFYMLAGNDECCKPDRHILSFLSSCLNKTVTINQANQLMELTTKKLHYKYKHITVRSLDYAIWSYMSNKGQLIVLNPSNNLKTLKITRTMKIDGYGFLDKSMMNSWEEKIVNKNKVQFDFANKLNNYIYSVYELITVLFKPKGVITDYIVANYVLMHKSYQSSIILLKMGLENDAKIILRTLQEKLIYIKCVEKDEVYFKIRVLEALNDRRNLINRIKEGTIDPGNLNVDDIEIKVNSDINDILEEINQSLGENYTQRTIKSKFQIKKFAEVAGMSQEYNLMYKVLSGNIHPDMNAIQAEFLTDKGFEYDLNPIYTDVHEYIQSLVDLLIRATEIVLNHFEIDTFNLKKLYNEEISIWDKSQN